MVIMLVPREKSRKVACILNRTEMLSTKATTRKKRAFSYIIQKVVDNNLSEERAECLTCDRSNYWSHFPHHPCPGFSLLVDPTWILPGNISCVTTQY